MNDHLHPEIKKILNSFTYPDPKITKCNECQCLKPCVYTQLIGWICQDCYDRLSERISRD